MGHFYFDSTSAFQTAFASHAQTIMADIPNQTDTQAAKGDGSAIRAGRYCGHATATSVSCQSLRATSAMPPQSDGLLHCYTMSLCANYDCCHLRDDLAEVL
jgi:hypothetical protein